MSESRGPCSCNSGKPRNRCHGQDPIRWDANRDERQLVDQLLFDKVVEEVNLSGSTSAVFVVRAENGSRSVLKGIRRDLYKDLVLKKRFDAEAKVWLLLPRHPNINVARQVTFVQGRTFLGTDFFPLGNLSDHVAANTNLRNDPSFILSVAVQICDAMVHLAGNGLAAHGDLKPQNVLMRDERNIVLSDFGLSRLRFELERGTDERITTTFAAPEIRRGAPSTVRSDIFSFGATLYWLVFGRLACRTTEGGLDLSGELLQVHPLRKILTASLATDPSQRLADFMSLRELLEKVASESYSVAIPNAEPARKMDPVQAISAAENLLAVGDFEYVLRAVQLGLDHPLLGGIPMFRDSLFVLQGWAYIGLRKFSLARASCDEVRSKTGPIGASVQKICAICAVPPDGVNDLQMWTGSPRNDKLQQDLSRAQAHIARGEFDIAIHESLRTLARYGDWDQIYVNLGNAYAGKGECWKQQCNEAFQNALAMNPHNKTTYYNFGLALFRQGAHEAALRHFDLSLDVDPRFSQAWAAKARLLYRHPDLATREEVARACRNAVAFDPENTRLEAEMNRYERSHGFLNGTN